MGTRPNYEELAAIAEKMRKWARDKGISFVTATQPRRGGPGLTTEQILEIQKQPLVIDYVGLMMPSPSKALVPVKE